ncbi:MAG: hypothetical protein AAGI01_04185 [Myxococcota bacterium]
MHCSKRFLVLIAMSLATPLMMGSSCGEAEPKAEAPAAQQPDVQQPGAPAAPQNIMQRTKREVEGSVDTRRDNLDGALKRSAGDERGIR